MGELVTVITPVGRFVQGDAFAGSDKDHQGRPKTDKAGNPKMQWFVGLAIAKTDPGWAALWQTITEVAQRDFPAGEYGAPNFAWKVVDGDAQVNAGKEGFPGHFILRCTSGFAPTVHDNTPQALVLTDPNTVKRGYYVRLSLSIRGNGEPANGKPGLYLNLGMVQFCGYGPEIRGGPDPVAVFAAPAALPPGASATPVATGPAPAPAPTPGQQWVAPPAAGPLGPGQDPAHWQAPGAPSPQPGAPAPGYLAPGPQSGAPAPGYPAPAAPAPDYLRPPGS